MAGKFPLHLLIDQISALRESNPDSQLQQEVAVLVAQGTKYVERTDEGAPGPHSLLTFPDINRSFGRLFKLKESKTKLLSLSSFP